jgi:hypothetical protein
MTNNTVVLRMRGGMTLLCGPRQCRHPAYQPAAGGPDRDE